MGDVVSATSSVKRSIKLRGDFIPSWHLLALIQSAHQFNALPKSLQLIQAGLGYHMNMVENFDNEEADVILTLDTEEGQEFFERSEAYMRIRMSQTYILETLEGAEAVLKVYPDLFEMYGKLSKKMSLDIAVVPTATVSEKEHTLGHRKSSFGQPRQDSVKSLSHPRSRSSTINNGSILSSSSIFDDNDSLNSSSFALPPAIEDKEDGISNVNNIQQIHEGSELTRSSTLLRVSEKEEAEKEEAMERKKSKHKQRRSFNSTRQFMDDPLLSFPAANRKKKEKKEPRPKKNGFLSFRNSNSNNSSPDPTEQRIGML